MQLGREVLNIVIQYLSLESKDDIHDSTLAVSGMLQVVQTHPEYISLIFLVQLGEMQKQFELRYVAQRLGRMHLEKIPIEGIRAGIHIVTSPVIHTSLLQLA